MQIYSFFNSSTSYRVRIALALKEVSADYHDIDLRSGEQSSAQYLSINPSGAVPLLIDDDGTVLSQSLAIVEYLDQTRGGLCLIPQAPLERARVMEVATLIGCDIHPLNNVRVLGYLKNDLSVDNERRAVWYKHWIEQGMQALESLLQRHGYGSYCFGEQPTLADCCLVPQVANALRMGCDLARYTLSMSIYHRCLEHPAFIQAAPENQPDYVA